MLDKKSNFVEKIAQKYNFFSNMQLFAQKNTIFLVLPTQFVKFWARVEQNERMVLLQ